MGMMRKRPVISFFAITLFVLFALILDEIPASEREVRLPLLLEANTALVTEAGQNRDDMYLVSRVIDGDTLDVEKDGIRVRVRLIGVDTPETVDPRRPVQCFGKEASLRAKELLEGRLVRLETDPSQGLYDRYDRMLAYVYLSDGTFFNKEMISQGYAHEYTHRSPYRYQPEFKVAERIAREEKRGLWADRVCAE
jgi:micrococcal nuclease